jgi:hypothetical protein
MCSPTTVMNVLSAELARKLKASQIAEASDDELFDAVDGSGFSAEPWKIRNAAAEDGGPSLREVREKHRPAELLPRLFYDALSAKDVAQRVIVDKHFLGKTQEELDAKYGPSRGKKKK